jgi:hypothetical protein
MSVDEDYFIPVRGGDSGTRIDTLAGGQNTSAIEDVEYIQKKLFASLKIPKAYLGYDEDIGSKATLAQEDIRFSRTITRIQKTILSELNKLAMVHLYAHGFTDEELLDFDLQLSNPSSIAQQQKLELINSKFSIASAAPEGLVSKTWILRNVMGFSRDEINQLGEDLMVEKLASLELEAAQSPGGDEGGAEEPGDEGGGLFSSDFVSGQILDGNKDTNKIIHKEIDEMESEDEELDFDKVEFSRIKKDSVSKNVFGGKLQKNKTQRQKHHIPDFASMTAVGRKARTQDSLNRPYDEDFVLGRSFSEAKLSDFLLPEKDEYLSVESPRLDKRMRSILDQFGSKFGFNNKVLSEGNVEEEFELDFDEEDYD